MADFDWVNARAQCSAAIMFARLRVNVKADVEKRSRLDGNWFFKFWSEEHAFFVSRERPNQTRTLSFVGCPTSIGVMDEDKERYIATLTLNNEGECRLSVNGQEMEEWQFRKMILEELFFGD
jgi:hypothetical protein